MLLLLLMYLSPFVAAALFWRSQSALAGVAADGDGAAAGGLSAWDTVRSSVEGRLAFARPVAGALLVPAVAIAAVIGIPAAASFVIGAAFAAFAAALTHAASLSAAANALRTTSDGVAARWPEASSMALGLAALAAGAIGTLAWFFADPAGAVVLGTFIGGASSSALFIGMTAHASRRESHLAVPAAASVLAREAAAWSVTSPMHAQLSAVAAALMVAATAEPEHLLGLGGLLAETETLRSQLLLLPVAVTVLSAVVAVVTGPVAATLLEKRSRASFFDVERIAAVVLGATVFGLVILCGLAWTVAGVFAIGLAARQLLVFSDQAALRSRRAGRKVRAGLPSLLPVVVAAGALAAGHAFAGWYGVAVAALGMSATFASSAASTSLRALCAYADAPAERPDNSDFLAADAAATLAGTLALLVAAAPVLTAASAHQGATLVLVATAAPGLLLGAVVGAACAASWSARDSNPVDEAENIRSAARAVVVAAVLPALAGVAMGTGAAVGVALGFTAWAAASAPLAPDEESASEAHPRLRRSALLAWARTMALSAVVGTTLVN